MTARSFCSIVLVVAVLASVPFLTNSSVVLNFLIVALLIALVGQGWNVLGGYGGQYSFGHAAFFGTGAYVTAIAQMRYGINAWAAFAAGVIAGAAMGAAIGFLTFRSGLRGSYFALVTLAFAEVLRILASVAPLTGAGVGILIALDLRLQAFQFQDRAPYYWIIMAFVAISLLLVRAMEQSRFGACLVAVRENEDAAMALGIDPLRVKLAAMIFSAALTAAGGCFYAQYYLFIDSGIAYGPWISVEALLAPIIGGVGTAFGPLIGALLVKSLGELTKLAGGDAPGLDLVIYGGALIVVVAFTRNGIAGLFAAVRARLPRFRWSVSQPVGPTECLRDPAAAAPAPLLSVEQVSKRFGGLLALDDVSLRVEPGRITALIGPNGAGKTTLFSVIGGFLPPDRGCIRYAGADITGLAPHILARRGLARTFQIVQPFAGLTVHENIAVGAHRRHRSRSDALAAAISVARLVGLSDLLDRPAATLTSAGGKRLELARALAGKPQLLLLDEVLAGLNPSELAAMLPVIRGLAESGMAILMVEHVMHAVMNLAEEVFVLAEGRVVAQGAPRAVVSDPQVIESYLGRGAAARLAGHA
jgi:branched-chain amino acid transport system permease protein